MATQEALIRRLRRLIDDVGHGYSQSAPGFTTDLSAGSDPLRIGIQIDDDLAPSDITLGAAASLTTGQAIAAAIQEAIRAVATTKEGYKNAIATFDRKDGYIIRSGSTGSLSYIRVTAPSAGTDVTGLLKLGQANGGYETMRKVSLSDDELAVLMDEALAQQNEVGTPTLWTYSTIPAAYESLIVYRAWASIVDIKLGQSANYHWQRVENEESHEDQIFGNFLKLADWLKKKIDELQDDLDGSSIEVSTASRWDYKSQQFIAVETHKDTALAVSIVEVSWEDATTAIVEFGELLSTGFYEINIGYKVDDPGVIDRAIYNDPNYEKDYAKTKGFVSPSVLARTIKNGRNTLLRITGLDQTKDTYFAAVAVDVDGIRYFSNEIMLAAVP